MAPQFEAPPRRTDAADEARATDRTTQTRTAQPTTHATTAEQTSPSFRELVAIGGLLVAYVGALTAKGVVRLIRGPLKHMRNQQVM